MRIQNFFNTGVGAVPNGFRPQTAFMAPQAFQPAQQQNDRLARVNSILKENGYGDLNNAVNMLSGAMGMDAATLQNKLLSGDMGVMSQLMQMAQSAEASDPEKYSQIKQKYGV